LQILGAPPIHRFETAGLLPSEIRRYGGPFFFQRRLEVGSVTSIRIDRFPFERDVNAQNNPPSDTAYATCLEIRRIVFTEGQGVPLDLEFDGLDAEAEHFIAWRIDGEAASAAGTARMRCIDGSVKAERVAVLESQRGSGIGRALMLAIEARATALEMKAVLLHAQVAVIPFYERLGYTAHGDVFEEAGIAHRSMTKLLA
jgi:predicted GNAT family N-acyltransferase